MKYSQKEALDILMLLPKIQEVLIEEMNENNIINVKGLKFKQN